MILQALSALALKELLDAGGRLIGASEDEPDAERLLNALAQRFIDQGERLTKALRHSGERAWRALEIALAGESLWTWLDRAEDKAFRQQVRDFLGSSPYHNLPAHGEEFTQRCLGELRAARKAGLFGAEKLALRDLAREASDFARYQGPLHLLHAQWAAVDRVANFAESAGHRALAHFLRLRPSCPGAEGSAVTGPPLLAIGMRYFFRRAVESDSALFRGLTFAQMEGVAQAQEAGFEALDKALAQHTAMLDQVIDQLFDLQRRVDEGLALQRQALEGQQQVGARLDRLGQDVRQLDLRAELEGVGARQAEMHREVIQALEQCRLERRELAPRDSLSLHGEGERKLVKQLVARYRALPAQERNLPALLNALGKLEVATGEYDSAQRDFQQAAALVRGEPRAEAEVHYNAYRTALERKSYDLALLKLRAAVQLDAARFAPFPFAKYEPLKVLGAGGFGVAVLCRHKFMSSQVVVKALVRDDVAHDSSLFAEAQHLRRLNHPCIIGIQDCGFEGEAGSARPYVVMDYFEGLTLEDHVKKHGPVSQAELPHLARALALGLAAAHGKGVLHRDVKPGNVLVRRVPSRPSAIPSPPDPFSQGGRGGEGKAGWQVKIIDFGLAVTHQAVGSTARQVDTLNGTVVGQSIQGTLDYGAPEQMGKWPGVPVSFASDVYGFGKTCCYALFGTPNLSYQDWKELDGPLAGLLGSCVNERPEKRLPGFQEVLQRLDQMLRPLVQVVPLPSRAGREEALLEVVRVEPCEPTKRRAQLRGAVEEVLEVIPASEPRRKEVGPVSRAAPEVFGSRNATDCTVTWNGHVLKACWNVWTGWFSVSHDGELVTSGWPVFGGAYPFRAIEDGVAVRYEVHVTGGLAQPDYLVRRNGVVLFQG